MVSSFDPEVDHFQRHNLAELLVYYKQKQEDSTWRLAGIRGNVEFRSKSCLRDIVFGPQFTRLEIKPFDERITRNALEMKPGPIPGFDSTIVYGKPSTVSPSVSPAEQAKPAPAGQAKKMKKSESTKKRPSPFLPQTIAHF